MSRAAFEVLRHAAFALAVLLLAAPGCSDTANKAQGEACEEADECVPVDCDGQEKQLCFRAKCETNPALVCL